MMMQQSEDKAGPRPAAAGGGQGDQAAAGRPYRSGFIAVVGRPNVGKSTLINALVGTQVAITSSRPETTRKAIRAVLTRPDAQLVLVDTPGIHRPRTLLGQRLNDVVDDSLADVDVVAFLLPADQKLGPGDEHILERLKANFARASSVSGPGRGVDQVSAAQTGADDHEAGPAADRPAANGHAPVGESSSAGFWKVPVICIVTKIDCLSRAKLVDKLIEIDRFGHFSQIVPVSALERDNLDEVESVLVDAVPEGPQMYEADTRSEESATDTIAELVRGAFLEELDDELPHSLAVVVDELDLPEAADEPATAFVSLYVERDSQKPIIIGWHAEHLVQVKKRVRTAVNRAVGRRTRLELHVKVSKEWQSDPKKLDRLGF